MIPGSASATLDCRMLPGQASQVIDEVKGRLGLDEVELPMIAEAPGRQSDWTKARSLVPLSVTCRRMVREIVAPVVSPGSTDSAWFRLKGVPSCMV